MADLTKEPPGLMIYDHRLLQHLAKQLNQQQIGLVHERFWQNYWPNEEEQAEMEADIKKRCKAAGYEADVACMMYTMLVRSSLRSLEQYRAKQQIGIEAANKQHNKEA